MKKNQPLRNNEYLSHYIRTFFEDYLVCRRNLSTCTIRSYRDVIVLFMRFSASRKKRKVAKLRVADIQPGLADRGMPLRGNVAAACDGLV